VSSFSHGAVSRVASVSAPGLMVMAVILSIGLISGAHLNPAVTLAFGSAMSFPGSAFPAIWWPGRGIGAGLPAAVDSCRKVGLLGRRARRGVGDLQAMVMEAALTFGLVTVILGQLRGSERWTALSHRRGGLHALAGLWAAPSAERR